MKQQLVKFGCGLAAAALAISLTACDDSSSATEPTSEEISSASETEGGNNQNGKGNRNIESSDDAESSDEAESSASTNNSSSSMEVTCQALTLECYSAVQLCNKGLTEYCVNSSASNNSSSSAVETCDHITDNECLITQGCALTPCMDGTKAHDCATNSDYVCKGGTWQVAETCTHLSDVEGSNKWTSTEPEFTITKDCSNGFYYMSVEGRWVKVEDCDPSKERCGFDNYKMCRETRLKQFCIDNSWVSEPCDPEVHGYERTLYTYDEPNNPQITSFSQMRYFCENGKWISESEVYNCDPMKDCAGIGY